MRHPFSQLVARLRRPLRTLPSVDAYALWSSSYPPHAHNALMKAEQEAMCTLLPALNGKAVLDLGSGTGRYGLLALQGMATPVMGLDNSFPMLRRSPLDHRVQASMDSLPCAAGAFDVVVCGLAVGHLEFLDDALREIGRVLRPGGVAVISDFHPLMFLRGARRTFTAPDGRVYAVEHHVHLYADYQRAAAGADLIIESVLEPKISPPNLTEPVRDSQAGPLVIVWKMLKRG